MVRNLGTRVWDIDRALYIVLGNYLHNNYDSIMPIMLLQITYVRNYKKQNYDCVEERIFFLEILRWQEKD